MSTMTLILRVLRILVGQTEAVQVLPTVFAYLGVTTARPPLMRVVTTCAANYRVSLMVPRDRTCGGGSVFYGGPDRANNGHDGACDEDRYFFSRGHEVACDDGMHHIITAISVLSIGTGQQCL